MLLVPVHSEAPEHWTLLSLASEPGQTVRCRYFETLPEASHNATVAAQAALVKEQNKAKAVSQLDSAPPPLPPPAEAPPQAEAAKAVPDARSGSRTFGCSKCRMAVSGCKDCNPAKALKWATKGSKAESEAKAKPGAKRRKEVK